MAGNNHNNRNWRRRWTVDVAARRAVHGPSGLIVQFEPHPEGGWAGESPNVQEVFQALKDVHGEHVASMLARLLREAGDIYAEEARKR